MALDPPVGGEEFNSHVRRLVEAFEVLNEELNDLRKRAPSLSYTEPANGRESARYIRQSTGWKLPNNRNPWQTHLRLGG